MQRSGCAREGRFIKSFLNECLVIPDYAVILLTTIVVVLIGARLYPQLGVQALFRNRHLWISKHHEKLEDPEQAT